MFFPGERFAYNDGGYVVLALIAERMSATSFHELVRSRACEPAGMHDTAFLRSDEPGERTAAGYLSGDGLRTNVLHLPVRGSGDGGVYTTAADISAMWRALYDGRITERGPRLGIWMPCWARDGADAPPEHVGLTSRTRPGPEVPELAAART